MEALRRFDLSPGILAYALLSTGVLITAFALEIYLLAIIPFIPPMILLMVLYPKLIFIGLFFTIPLSRHVNVAMGLSTEAFSEQLMWLLCIIAGVAFLNRGQKWDYKYLVHPISLLLILHLAWIAITTIVSVNQVTSIKFLMAKSWFIVALFACGLYFFREKNLWKVFFWCTYIPLSIVIVLIMYWHMQEGFSFQSINKVINTFFSNHVYYAAVLVLFLPFIFLALRWYPRFSLLWWIILVGVVTFPIAIVLSYTRAAIVVMAGYIFIYWAFKLRLMRWGMIAGFIGMALLAFYTVKDNHYLTYAPEYSKTVSYDQFGNLIEATYAGKDISTMERIYRWVAAYQMIQEKPLLGYGPSTFPAIYKSHTLNMFATYVSDNKEGSGIHNYYLMILVEQGIFGLLIFLALVYYVIAYGEKVYHRTRDTFSKQLLSTFLVVFVGLFIMNLMNDLIEVDKMACYFFWTMVVLILVDFKTYDNESQSIELSDEI